MPINNQITFRKGLSSLWTSTNPVLASGEPGYETDTGRFKIGNGSNWNSTNYTAIVPSGFVAGTGISISLGSNGSTATITSTGSGILSDQAKSLVTTVFNNTGSSIAKMSAVYINGGQGDQPTIQLAIATGDATSAATYGVTYEAISSMNTGQVVVLGALGGVNTDQFNPTAPVGDVNGYTLYLSPTVSGALTTTKPSAPNHMVVIGTIVRTHQNDGVIEVNIQNGLELEELHDVKTSGVTNGQFLQYNTASGLWLPSSSGNFTTLQLNGIGVSVNGHSHTSSDITDFNEAVDDRIGSGLFSAGTGINLSYNDGSNSFTVSVSGIVSNPTNNRILSSRDTTTTGIDAETNLVFTGSNLGVNTIAPSGALHVVGTGLISSVTGTVPNHLLHVYSATSGANIFNVEGTNGSLFSVVDNLSGSLMSVNNNAGLPVFEVFSDDRVIAGRFNQNDFVLTSGGNIGIGTSAPSGKLHVVGNTSISGTLSSTSGNFTNSLTVNGSGVAIISGTKLNQFASTSSSELLGVISDETGSGLLVFNNSPTLTGIPLTPTAASGTNTNQIASTAFVRTEISNLVASAPSTLDTLNELASALGNDANFSTTVTNSLASKANLSGAAFSGSISAPTGNFTVLQQNGVGVSTVGHTHTASNITDFNTSVSGLLPTISNSGDNRILTSTGSSVGINAESNLTFDGTNLIVNSGLTATTGNFTSSLRLNNVGVSVSGHTHTSSDITNFSSAVSGLVSGVYVPVTRTITPGSGLVGTSGLDLSADRTLHIGQGDGISVNSNTVAVDNTVLRTTGNQTIIGNTAFDTSDGGSFKVYDGLVNSTLELQSNADFAGLPNTTILHTNPPNSGVYHVYLPPSGTISTSNDIAQLSGNLQTQINSKQNTLTNPVTGTGIANHVAYWNSSSGIVADSGQLYWDATNNRLGVGTGSPSGALHVIGTGIFSSGLLVNGVNVSVSGHSHTASNITDFQSSIQSLISTTREYSSEPGIDSAWFLTSLGVGTTNDTFAGILLDNNALSVNNNGGIGQAVFVANRDIGIDMQGPVTIGPLGGDEISYGEAGLNITGKLTVSKGLTNHTAAVFKATDNQPPASAFATLDTRNSIAVLDFDDTTKESAVFVGVMPPQTYLPSGLSIRTHWMATTATTGDVRWEVSLERCNTDLDADSFDTVATGSSTTNGTAGIVTVTSITLTTIDGVTAGDLYRLKVSRDAANGADTMVGDAELVAVEVRSAV